MPKNIKGTSTLAGKNVQNSESIGNLTADTIRTNTLVATNATITNLTNTELQTATSNIATNTTNIATNTSDIATNTGNIATNTSNISTNTSDIATNASNISTNTGNIATNTSDIASLQTSKQDALTVSNPIDLTSDNLSLNIDDSFFFINGDGELQLKVILDYGYSNVFINSNRLVIQNQDADINLDLNDSTNNYAFRIFFNHDDYHTFFRIRGDVGGYIDIMTLSQDDIDFHSLPLLNVASINGITSTELGYLDGTSSNIQFQLDQKQAVLTAGNGIDITAGLGTTISVDEAELTTKQDVITDATNIELNDLTVNDTIFFQKNDSTDTKTNITRSSTAGKMRFNAESYAFKDETNSTTLFSIDDTGTIECDAITLNGSDLQGKLDDKADLFGILLPLE